MKLDQRQQDVNLNGIIFYTQNSILSFKMIRPNYTQSHQFSQLPHSTKPHPPNEKIISSKDQAIHQLIYENTMLKKQLSQLMLKTTVPAQYSPLNASESPMTSVRPSVSHLGSYRNSMENSMEFSTSPHCAKVNKLTANDNICEGRTQHDLRIVVQRQNKREYRRSVDSLCSGYQQQAYNQIHQPYQNRQLLDPQPCQVLNAVPLVVNQREFSNRHLNNSIKTPPYLYQYQQSSSTEQDMYREKMLKLKARRNSHSKRLSQEKNENKHLNNANCAPFPHHNLTKTHQAFKTPNQFVARYVHANQAIKTITPEAYQSPNPAIKSPNISPKLVQAHEVLKSKLKSSEKVQRQNKKANEAVSNKPMIDQSSPNHLSQTHDKKMIPKYTPKNFSQQKQNKIHPQQPTGILQFLKNNLSQKTVDRKPTQTTSQEASRINLRPQVLIVKDEKKGNQRKLRGCVYLEDEGQGGRTKRALSRNSNNSTTINTSVNKVPCQVQNQATKRNSTKQSKHQHQRINTAESQLTYIVTNSFRRVSVEDNHNSCSEKSMKKNSNKVYLEEDQNDRFNIKRVHNSKVEQKPKEVTETRVQKVHRMEVDQEVEELVSIEQIHMIGSEKCEVKESSKKPIVATHKRSSPPLSKQTTASNHVSGNKNLYNDIYCVQSKKDVHS